MADTEDSRERDRLRTRAWRAANAEKAKEVGRKSDAKRRGQPRYVYKGHKTSAKQRGVAFLLTFDEWWALWDTSGKWEHRGRETNCYVMARFGDEGPYKIGNVRICTSQENNSEAHKGKIVSNATRERLSALDSARGPITEKQREAVTRGRATFSARCRAARER